MIDFIEFRFARMFSLHDLSERVPFFYAECNTLSGRFWFVRAMWIVKFSNVHALETVFDADVPHITDVRFEVYKLVFEQLFDCCVYILYVVY